MEFFLKRHVQLRGIKRERVFFNRNLLVSLLSGKSRAVIKSQDPRHQSTLIIITSSINLREKIEQSSTCAWREKHNCCENPSHHKFLPSTTRWWENTTLCLLQRIQDREMGPLKSTPGVLLVSQNLSRIGVGGGTNLGLGQSTSKAQN